VQNKDPILVGKLFQGVEGSTWHVETKTRTLTVELEKDASIAWPLLIVGPGPAPADKMDAQSLFYLGEAFEQVGDALGPCAGPVRLARACGAVLARGRGRNRVHRDRAARIVSFSPTA